MKITTYDMTVEYYENDKKLIQTYMALKLPQLEFYKEQYSRTHEKVNCYVTTNVITKNRSDSVTESTTVYESLSPTKSVINPLVRHMVY